MPLQVTLSYNTSWRERAIRLAEVLGGRFVDRRAVDPSAPALVVDTRGRLIVRQGGHDFRWHEGLLHTRREAGARHPLIRALVADGAPRTVLDATLGLGTDATFVAETLGARVIGVEANPVLALMAAEGLRGRVDVVCAESGAFLRGLRRDAVDVVFADPLFTTGQSGTSLALVRAIGREGPVDGEWLAAALAAAPRAVVKDAVGGTLLEALGAVDVIAGRRTRYGVFRRAG